MKLERCPVCSFQLKTGGTDVYSCLDDVGAFFGTDKTRCSSEIIFICSSSEIIPYFVTEVTSITRSVACSSVPGQLVCRGDHQVVMNRRQSSLPWS